MKDTLWGSNATTKSWFLLLGATYCASVIGLPPAGIVVLPLLSAPCNSQSCPKAKNKWFQVCTSKRGEPSTRKHTIWSLSLPSSLDKKLEIGHKSSWKLLELEYDLLNVMDSLQEPMAHWRVATEKDTLLCGWNRWNLYEGRFWFGKCREKNSVPAESLPASLQASLLLHSPGNQGAVSRDASQIAFQMVTSLLKSRELHCWRFICKAREQLQKHVVIEIKISCMLWASSYTTEPHPAFFFQSGKWRNTADIWWGSFITDVILGAHWPWPSSRLSRKLGWLSQLKCWSKNHLEVYSSCNSASMLVSTASHLALHNTKEQSWKIPALLGLGVFGFISTFASATCTFPAENQRLAGNSSFLMLLRKDSHQFRIWDRTFITVILIQIYNTDTMVMLSVLWMLVQLLKAARCCATPTDFRGGGGVRTGVGVRNGSFTSGTINPKSHLCHLADEIWDSKKIKLAKSAVLRLLLCQAWSLTQCFSRNISDARPSQHLASGEVGICVDENSTCKATDSPCLQFFEFLRLNPLEPPRG